MQRKMRCARERGRGPASEGRPKHGFADLLCCLEVADVEVEEQIYTFIYNDYINYVSIAVGRKSGQHLSFPHHEHAANAKNV